MEGVGDDVVLLCPDNLGSCPLGRGASLSPDVSVELLHLFLSRRRKHGRSAVVLVLRVPLRLLELCHLVSTRHSAPSALGGQVIAAGRALLLLSGLLPTHLYNLLVLDKDGVWGSACLTQLRISSPRAGGVVWLRRLTRQFGIVQVETFPHFGAGASVRPVGGVRDAMVPRQLAVGQLEGHNSFVLLVQVLAEPRAPRCSPVVGLPGRDAPAPARGARVPWHACQVLGVRQGAAVRSLRGKLAHQRVPTHLDLAGLPAKAGAAPSLKAFLSLTLEIVSSIVQGELWLPLP